MKKIPWHSIKRNDKKKSMLSKRYQSITEGIFGVYILAVGKMLTMLLLSRNFFVIFMV